MKNYINCDSLITLRPADILKKLPVVIRVNEFTEESAKDFSEAMSNAHETGQPVIPIVIDSYGGYAASLQLMIDEIQTSKIPVATIIEGKAMSCGAILAGFGAHGYRYAAPSASVMVHEISAATWGRVEEMKADTKETDRMNNQIYTKLAKYCGHDAHYFLDMMDTKKHADWYLTPASAKKHGLVDVVGIPEFVTTISVTYSFE